MKNIVWLAVLFLAGCDKHQELIQSIPEPIIVMECNGEDISMGSSKREPATYLIKVDSNNFYRKSLFYYSGQEQRFDVGCESKFLECNLGVNLDQIQEVGIVRNKDNEIITTLKTVINRRTGEMRKFVLIPGMNDDNDYITFEGICKKGELPAEQPQKF